MVALGLSLPLAGQSLTLDADCQSVWIGDSLADYRDSLLRRSVSLRAMEAAVVSKADGRRTLTRLVLDADGAERFFAAGPCLLADVRHCSIHGRLRVPLPAEGTVLLYNCDVEDGLLFRGGAVQGDVFVCGGSYGSLVMVQTRVAGDLIVSPARRLLIHRGLGEELVVEQRGKRALQIGDGIRLGTLVPLMAQEFVILPGDVGSPSGVRFGEERLVIADSCELSEVEVDGDLVLVTGSLERVNLVDVTVRGDLVIRSDDGTVCNYDSDLRVSGVVSCDLQQWASLLQSRSFRVLEHPGLRGFRRGEVDSFLAARSMFRRRLRQTKAPLRQSVERVLEDGLLGYGAAPLRPLVILALIWYVWGWLFLARVRRHMGGEFWKSLRPQLVWCLPGLRWMSRAVANVVEADPHTATGRGRRVAVDWVGALIVAPWALASLKCHSQRKWSYYYLLFKNRALLVPTTVTLSFCYWVWYRGDLPWY